MKTTYRDGEYLVTVHANGSVERVLAPENVPELVQASDWWIDIGPFFDRAGSKKLAILASTDPVVQAIVKDAQIRQYIDLQRPDVAQALDLLVSKGLLAAEDKAMMLTAPPTDHERHVKR